MRAEVLSIGDELTSGLSLDTNARWLSQQLENLGIGVACHTTVADDLDVMTEAFRTAIRRADVVVATGGLGPTADDLTRDALAATVGRPLVRDDAALQHIRCLFAHRHREMPERNKLQAMFPAGSRIVLNPHGTAPGIAIEVPRGDTPPVHFYCLPGVPAEMHEMWFATLQGELRRLTGSRVIRHRRIKCFGAGESAIEAMLPEMIRRGRHPRVGITASEATISLNVTAEGATEEECLAAMEPTLATIRTELGHLVYGEGDDRLEDAVVRLLGQQGATLATVEWATEGLITQGLQAAAHGGPETPGGLVVAQLEALTRLLDVPAEPLAVGRVELVETMALAARRKFVTNYALAVGPPPQIAEDNPTNEPVVVALATPEGVRTKNLPLLSHPAIQKAWCAKMAIDLLRLELLGR
ncbi:MAG: CinA family protein [Pirellulales bacterium]|nr:CinA family protein [Pirellulales bacterium]